MHAEVDFIFHSSAKITIKLNLVYLFNETQDLCPDGFNQSPRYVVIRGSLPWFCFYLAFRMCSQFKFPEILAAKCCLIDMQIVQRGPLNTHSCYRNAAPFSTSLLRGQPYPGKCYLLSGTTSFHSGDVPSPLIPCTHEDSEAGVCSEPGLPVSQMMQLCLFRRASLKSGPGCASLAQASPELNSAREMGFF